MGAIASYSGQIFNNYIGFSVNILGGIKVDKYFDVFGLTYDEKKKANPKLGPPYENWFMMTVIGTVIAVIVITAVYLSANKFVLSKKFTSILFAVYLTFFSVGLVFAYLSRPK